MGNKTKDVFELSKKEQKKHDKLTAKMAALEARIRNVNSVASHQMEATRTENAKYQKDLDKLKVQTAKIMSDAHTRYDNE